MITYLRDAYAPLPLQPDPGPVPVADGLEVVFTGEARNRTAERIGPDPCRAIAVTRERFGTLLDGDHVAVAVADLGHWAPPHLYEGNDLNDERATRNGGGCWRGIRMDTLRKGIDTETRTALLGILAREIRQAAARHREILEARVAREDAERRARRRREIRDAAESLPPYAYYSR